MEKTQPDRAKRSRSRSARILAAKTRVAELEAQRQQEKERLKALQAIDKLAVRKGESRDKLLIGVAALAAARTDSAVRTAIDVATGGLSERERAHLGRNGSLWVQLVAEAPDGVHQVKMLAASEPLLEPSPATGDDPDLAPISFMPDQKRLWRWYDDWDDHSSVFNAMRMERNAFGYWLAKTYTQEQALALLGRHPVTRFDGMSKQEAENFIYAECETVELDLIPLSPEQPMVSHTEQQVRARHSGRRSLKR